MEERNTTSLRKSTENDDKSCKKLVKETSSDDTSREKTHGGGTCGETECNK